MDFDEHVIDLLPAYALGALDENEALEVDRHLPECASCRAELAANQEIVDVLPLAVRIVEDPPGLKASIIAAAAAGGGEEAPAPASATKSTGFGQRWLPVWGVVSLVLILLLGLVNLSLWNQLQQVTGALESTLQVISLTGTEHQPDAAGLMVVGGDGHVGALIVDNLPVLDEQYEYQLWLIGDDGREDGGVFSVSELGYGVKYIHSDDPLLSYNGFGITIEPAGGSSGPTGDKVLGVDF
ncbi:MAG: anti-sigma factor [Anaerolineales bacterium]|nr:anti-sigma factor [Anaerolineales bacterium]